MDDFNIASLHESRNEWISRLVTILTPNIFSGFKKIFEDAVNLATTQQQKEKYLMTFQNLLIQIPKWNNDIINVETERIISVSQCNYIEDLITCVHIIQLKALTCVRVGQSEKNVNINIPKLNDFIHRIYVNSARSIYSNIYLFEQEIMPLQIQQNYNKVDALIKEAIIESVRQSMPIDEILRTYLEDKNEIVEPANAGETALSSTSTTNNSNDSNNNNNNSNNVSNVDDSSADQLLSDEVLSQDVGDMLEETDNIQIAPETDLFDITSEKKSELENIIIGNDNSNDNSNEHVTFPDLPDMIDNTTIQNNDFGIEEINLDNIAPISLDNELSNDELLGVESLT